MDNIIKQIHRIREAGQVERCHVLPHIGSYNVAMHSWHAAMLLLELYPGASRNLLEHILRHDTAERWTGDIPATAKWQFPKLKEASQKAEEHCLSYLDMYPPLLTEEENLWLHAIDTLELFLWCYDQIFFGNQHIKGIKENILSWVEGHTSLIPLPVLKIFQTYEWNRCKDILEDEINET